MARYLSEAEVADKFVLVADDLVRAGLPARTPDYVFEDLLGWDVDGLSPSINCHSPLLEVLGRGRGFAADLTHDAVVFGRADGTALAIETVEGPVVHAQQVELIGSDDAFRWLADRQAAWHWIGLAIDAHFEAPSSPDDAVDPALTRLALDPSRDLLLA